MYLIHSFYLKKRKYLGKNGVLFSYHIALYPSETQRN